MSNKKHLHGRESSRSGPQEKPPPQPPKEDNRYNNKPRYPKTCKKGGK